jgi:hypothetical protein
MIRIHSPRPFRLNSTTYKHQNSTRPDGSAPAARTSSYPYIIYMVYNVCGMVPRNCRFERDGAASYLEICLTTRA